MILKKTTDDLQESDFEVLKVINDCHEREITQILCLTDFFSRLSFVTMSLDGLIKIFNDEGGLEREIMALG